MLETPGAAVPRNSGTSRSKRKKRPGRGKRGFENKKPAQANNRAAEPLFIVVDYGTNRGSKEISLP
jgi:hypothetical protein